MSTVTYDDRVGQLERELAVVKTEIGHVMGRVDSIDRDQRDQEQKLIVMQGAFERMAERFDSGVVRLERVEDKFDKAVDSIVDIKHENDRLVRRILVALLVAVVLLFLERTLLPLQ